MCREPQTMNQDLFTLMTSEEDNTPQDKLDKITRKMREARDLRLDISELENKLKDAKTSYNLLVQRELPDLMNEVRQNHLELKAEGNHGAISFRLKPYYKANISNDDPNCDLAYQWLEEHGEGDIIRRSITANLGKESEELQVQILEILESLGIEPETKFGVPWNTLTAWLKDRHLEWISQQGRYVPPEDRVEMPPLEIFGATIGQVVEIKDQK
jgi:hypothetical protein